MTKIDTITTNILGDLVLDFVARTLPASDLSDGYVGIDFALLRDKHAEDSAVDFDLAVSELEKAGLVKTGPMEMYDNKPGSGVFVLGFYSKREYLHLTDKGYREAQKRDVRSRQIPTKSHHVAINNSNIFQSAIGAGDHFNQSLNIENNADVIDHLLNLARKSGRLPEQEVLTEVTNLVAAARSANLNEVKPIFQRLYGVASNGVGQVAWGVVSALLAASLGIG